MDMDMLLGIKLNFLNRTDLLAHLDPVLVIYLQFEAPTLQLVLLLNYGTPFRTIYVVKAC